MKKKIILALLLCSTFISANFSQTGTNNTNKISGIGFLKINTTTIDVINEIEEKLHCVNKIINTSNNYFEFTRLNKQKNYIIEFQPDTLNKYHGPHQASICNKTKVFEIKGLFISNIELKDLKLTFYDKILIEINCEKGSDLIDGIHLKYGEGQKDIRTKKVTCTYKINGNQVEYEANTISENWENEDILATAVTSVYYNDKCEKNYINYISIYSLHRSKLNNMCEEETQLRIDNKAKQEKRKNLNDL